MKRQRIISLGTRFAAFTVALIGVISTAVFFGLSAFEWRTLEEGRVASAQEVMALFSELVAVPLVFEDSQSLEDGVTYVTKNPDLLFARVTSLASGEQAVAHMWLKAEASTEPLADAPGTRVESDRVVIHRDVKDGDGKVIGRATLTFSMDKERAAYVELRRQILLGAVTIALLLILPLVLMVRQRVSRPLGALTHAARRLEQGEVVEVNTSSTDEVGVLAGAFTRMAHTLREREALIARRNRDMKLVLDNVSQGFVLVDPAGRLMGERSAIADVWFSPPSPGQALVDWLAPHDSRWRALFSMSWDQLTEGFLPPEVCVDQLPARLEREGRVYRIQWQVITAPVTDQLSTVVVVVTDVTNETAQEARAAAQAETVAIFEHLVKDRAGFMDFVVDGRALLAGLTPEASPAEHFRAVHTIKGNASVMGVHSLARVCHGIEERLAGDRDRVTPAEKALMEVAWERLEQRTRELSGNRDALLEVPVAEVKELSSRLAARAPHAELELMVEAWHHEPVRVHLERLAEHARGLAQRLGKAPVTVEVRTGAERLPPGMFGGVWASLVHVLRNAVDHGLEAPFERGPKGPAAIRLAARLEQDRLAVELEDDGRGIDWDRLAAKAGEQGLPAATHDDLVAALFADGVSTRAEASETSGRGVGMAAVKQAVERCEGHIAVTSERGQGTRVTVELPVPSRGRLAAVA